VGFDLTIGKTIVLTVIVCVAAIIGAVLVMAMVTYRRRRRTYDSLTLADVRAQADLLLGRGYEGAVMVVTDIPSARFVQFKKYIHRKGSSGSNLDSQKRRGRARITTKSSGSWNAKASLSCCSPLMTRR
jgi:hypothetical protein